MFLSTILINTSQIHNACLQMHTIHSCVTSLLPYRNLDLQADCFIVTNGCIIPLFCKFIITLYNTQLYLEPINDSTSIPVLTTIHLTINKYQQVPQTQHLTAEPLNACSQSSPYMVVWITRLGPLAALISRLFSSCDPTRPISCYTSWFYIWG